MDLPQSSRGSIRGGIWFVFQVGKQTVRAWMSMITGAERIYAGDNIVSVRRPFISSKSAHTFKLNQDEYTVIFTSNFLKGDAQCSLYVNNKGVKSYSTQLVESPAPEGNSIKVRKDNLLLVVVVSFFVSLLIASLGNYFGWPNWLQFVLIVIALLVLHHRRKSARLARVCIDIVELPLPPDLGAN